MAGTRKLAAIFAADVVGGHIRGTMGTFVLLEEALAAVDVSRSKRHRRDSRDVVMGWNIG